MTFFGVPVPRKVVELYFRWQARPSLLTPAPQFHSSPGSHAPSAGMKVRIIPALADNYMYLVIDEKTMEAAVVDPVEPESVFEAVRDERVNLTTVLTTHHHWDHAGGNEKLIAAWQNSSSSSSDSPALNVIGGDNRIGGLTSKKTHDDVIHVGNLRVRCLATPCHTSGHLCYHVTDGGDVGGDASSSSSAGAVFTGDTLFISGCGKFFEGTGQQMHRALIGVLSQLPDETAVYVGHEYTEANLAFATHVEPESADLVERVSWASALRGAGKPTTPSTIGMEKRCNPFMRVEEESVQRFTKTLDDGVATMTALRRAKDNFKRPKK